MINKNCLIEGECIVTIGQFLAQHNKDILKKDLYLILDKIEGIDKLTALTQPNTELKKCELLQSIVSEHKKGKPIEYLLNTGFFMGMEFYVDENVLIPREDTECLIEEILTYNKQTQINSLLDMCSGSGCIAISLKKLCMPQTVEVTAVDISEQAVEIIKKNANLLGANEIKIVCSDLFAQLNTKYDVIVSNPPYIATEIIKTLEPNVKDYEPMLALDGGTDGLDFYRKLAGESKAYLNEGGTVFLEIGYDQGQSVKSLFEQAGYKNVSVKQDYAGLDRIIIAKS